MAQSGQHWDGGWNSSHGDRRISGGSGKSGIVYHRASVFFSLGAWACGFLEEKGAGGDRLCAVFADFLFDNVGAVTVMKGSLTVEAALVVPIVLLCIFQFLTQGITLYCQVVELAEEQEFWEEYDPPGRFRQLELLEELVGDHA